MASRSHMPGMTGLRTLEAFDRLGSMAAAGQALGLTQSAVSRQLKTLEGRLGVALFVREGRNLVLTPAAQDYAAEMRDVLARVAQASLRLASPPADGRLNLAILPTFGMRWLVPRLPDFARAHPEVTINPSTRLKPFNFAAEDIDAAIHFGTPDWPQTGHMRLRAESVLPVASPDFLTRNPVRAAADLAALPLLQIETRPEAWAHWFAAHGVDAPRVAGTRHDQFATILQAAQHGLGVGLLPTYLAQPDIASGRLRPAWGPPTQVPGAYYLLWPETRAASPALTAFRDWLATQTDDEDLLPR